MSSSTHTVGSDDAFDSLISYPSPSRTSSEEEDPSEYMGSDQEANSSRRSLSRSRSSPSMVRPQPLPPQPTMGGIPPRFRATARISVPMPAPAAAQPPGRTQHLAGDPYAAGPSRVSDHYTWERLLERETRARQEATPPQAVTRVPPPYAAEQTLEDHNRIEALIADRQYDRASLALFERRLLLNTEGTRRLAPHTLRATEVSLAAHRTASRAMAWIYSIVAILVAIIVALVAYIVGR